MRLALFFVVFCCLTASPSRSAAQSPEERARLDWVEQRGRLVYDLDGAAWVGTDDMRARVPDTNNQRIRGYVVERDGAEFAITFYAGAAESPVAVYRGHVANRRVVRREVFPAESRPVLTDMQRRLAAASDAARALDRRPCGAGPFNTVAIPTDSAGGSIDVYLLTPQARNNEWPMGGHFRATVSPTGVVGSSRAFTNSCLAIGGPGNGAAMMVTHLLDPIPTEIHVFTALASRIPVFVGTNNPRRLWAIVNGRIRLIAVDPEPSRP